MTVIYMSDDPDHPAFTDLAQKYTIGDKVKVIKITLTHNDPEDTRQAFLSVLGKIGEIKEINLWEGLEGRPWLVSYEIEVNETESVFLKDEEIELAEKA